MLQVACEQSVATVKCQAGSLQSEGDVIARRSLLKALCDMKAAAVKAGMSKQKERERFDQSDVQL